MLFFKYNAVALIGGYLLDILIGDPEGWPHPVIWIGKWISWMEKRLRAKGGNLRRGALLLTASTVLIAMAVTALILFLLSLWGRVPLLIGMTIISWTIISARCLDKEGRGVAKAMKKSLEAGRKRVARIVGRDTAELSGEEVLAATVETVAENTTDGVIAPLLFLFIGGPIAAMGFKAASTLDSMVGYLDEKYRDIGWSSAKFDDILNFIPARICGPLMCLAAAILGMDGANAWHIMCRDHANHLSPNCAWSEAAAAGAMHIQLGGTHMYFGKPVEKPTIGDRDREIEPEDILRTGRLMYVSSAILCLIFAVIGVIL